MTKLIVAIQDFANVPKNICTSSHNVSIIYVRLHNHTLNMLRNFSKIPQPEN
jgi:hypothetical protein